MNSYSRVQEVSLKSSKRMISPTSGCGRRPISRMACYCPSEFSYYNRGSDVYPAIIYWSHDYGYRNLVTRTRSCPNCREALQIVAIGTLIGSNITDPLLSIGLTALVHPVTIGSSDIFFYLIIPATIITTGLSLLFMYTDFKFQRWEGGVLVACYAIFVGLLIAASNII